MTDPRLRVVVWNAEWAPPKGVRGRRVAELLAGLDADVIHLTEGHPDLLPAKGQVAVGEAPDDVAQPGARRVLLWSRWPLHDVDPVGHPRLPHRAFVSATAQTPLGSMDLWSVCIPWADAGVARFGGERKRWEEHAIYLDVLAEMLRKRPPGRPLVVAGDFNQYLPRIWGPAALSEKLLTTFGGMEWATTGTIDGLGAQVIDHVVHTPDLSAEAAVGWPGRTSDDTPMSDHSGVRIDLGRPGDGPGA